MNFYSERKKEMENKKNSLSTIFLVIAIILIAVMGVCMYKQKIESDKQIAQFKNNANELQETINNLQEKIDIISNTINLSTTSEVNNTKNEVTDKEQIEYDIEVPLSEIENIKIAVTNDTSIRDFYNKYYGKKLKITGYVSAFGNEYDTFLGNEFATGVNIGNSETYETRTSVQGVTYDSNVAKKINNLKVGQKISIIGILPNPNESMSLPVALKALDIIIVE